MDDIPHKNSKAKHYGTIAAVVAGIALCGVLTYYRSQAVLQNTTTQLREAIQLRRFSQRSDNTRSMENPFRGGVDTPATYLAKLSPLGSGRGIVVCEPTSDATLSSFGAGCGRWLHLALAGQSELNATPAWADIDKVRSNMGAPDWRLNLDQALRLHRALGVTNAAIGVIKGDSNRCELSYQLYDLNSKSPMGSPLAIAGTPEQITQGLPQLARQLASALGVGAPEVPEKTDLSSAEIAFLGSIAWDRGKSLTQSDLQRWGSLAKRNSLAAVLLSVLGLKYSFNPVDLWALQSQALLSPDQNLSAVSVLTETYLSTDNSRLAKLALKFPDNYQLAQAIARIQGQFSEREHAEIEVRCAPQSALAWRHLAETLFNQADRTRNAKSVGQMNAAEQQIVFALYPLEQAAAQRAVDCDPEDSKSWLTLSQAAAFAGDGRIADTALQKSLQCIPVDGNAYFWSIELYQEKWFADKAMEKKMIGLGVNGDDKRFSLALSSLLHLYNDKLYNHAPLDSDERAFIQIIDSRGGQWRLAHPKRWDTMADLGYFYSIQNIFPEAEASYKQAIAVNPMDSESHFRYGYCLERSNDKRDAIGQYQAAHQLNPRDGDANAALARLGAKPLPTPTPLPNSKPPSIVYQGKNLDVNAMLKQAFARAGYGNSVSFTIATPAPNLNSHRKQ